MAIGRQGGYSPDYPSDVRDGPGLRFEKRGLALRARLDYRNVEQLDTVPGNGLVIVQDPDTDEFGTINFANLPIATPGDGTVTNAKLAPSAPLSFKGNAATDPASPTDLSPSDARAVLGAGTAGGLATLDGGGAVPTSQLPPPGDTGTAGATVGGQRVLVSQAGQLIHGSADTADHFGRVVGVSANAAITGAPVRYVSAGVINDPSFSFTEGPVFAGLNGTMTQTYPTVGGGFVFLQQIGYASSSTRLLIQIAPPILLA